ncbi:MAG: hypothetical protein ABI950_00455 [Solirubrobacteraceae bacterium]
MVGLVLLAYGITAFIFGGHSFKASPLSGTVNGKTWMGLEVNAWTSLLFAGSGLLLLFGAPLHWGAKGLALVVGLVLGACAIIAAYDKTDVFGISAANGLTKLVWAIAAVVLATTARSRWPWWEVPQLGHFRCLEAATGRGGQSLA